MAVDQNSLLTQGFLRCADGLLRYHRHRVFHLERLGRALESGRKIILVGNHAFSVVDPLLFTASVYREFGVVPRFMGHHKGWFETPVLRDIVQRYNVIPSRSMSSAAEALDADRFLMLFPGGATEAALRVLWSEPYRLKWEDRRGFLKLALEHDADVMFVAAVGIDDQYYQSRIGMPKVVPDFADRATRKAERVLHQIGI
jgi:hypothetical protein